MRGATRGNSDWLTGERQCWGRSRGSPGNCVIDFVLRAANMPPREPEFTYFLLDPRWVRLNRRFDERTGRRTRCEPDVVVSRVRDGRERHELVVAVEVKGKAAVNYVRCPADVPEHRGYSNQLICYAASCWLSDDAIGRHTLRYVWLGLRDDIATGAFPPRALTGGIRDAFWAGDAETAEQAWRLQNASLKHWHQAAIEELADALRDVAPPVGEVLSEWVRRLSPAG